MNTQGKVFKYPDNVDTDVIIPARYLNTPNAAELALHGGDGAGAVAAFQGAEGSAQLAVGAALDDYLRAVGHQGVQLLRVRAAQADASGSVTVSIESLSAGVYVLQSSASTFKFVK